VKGNSDGDLAIRTRLSKYTVMDLMSQKCDRDAVELGLL
jgi:hypothetical protein